MLLFVVLHDTKAYAHLKYMYESSLLSYVARDSFFVVHSNLSHKISLRKTFEASFDSISSFKSSDVDDLPNKPYQEVESLLLDFLVVVDPG